MKKVHLIALGLVAAAVIGVFSLKNTIAQSAGRRSAPTSVAVCDVVEVFAKYQRAKDLTAQLEGRQKTIQAENQKRIKQLEALQTELTGYVAGKPEHDRVLEKIQQLTIERQVWLKMQETSIMRDHLRMTEDMFKQIKDTIAAVAKNRGYDIVVQLEPRNLTARNATELVAQIDRRKVLYSATHVNVTEAVLQKLNETYRIKNK